VTEYGRRSCRSIGSSRKCEVRQELKCEALQPRKAQLANQMHLNKGFFTHLRILTNLHHLEQDSTLGKSAVRTEERRIDHFFFLPFPFLGLLRAVGKLRHYGK